MHRKLLLPILLCISSLLCFSTYAQQQVLPDDLVLDERFNYDKYTSYIVPSVDWIQKTPIDSDKVQRRRLNNFIMIWLQKNNHVVVNMPEYLLRFQNASNELYFLHAGGWMKYVLTTGDTIQRNCFIAAAKSVLDFYGANPSIKRTDFVDNIYSVYKQGNLETLFANGNTPSATYLLLVSPANKHDFSPSENYFQFRFNAANLTDFKSIRYRYKLAGYYDKWIETNEESATFPSLPAGDYTFTVQTSTSPDFSNAVEKSYSFSIASPFYKQTWFILLIAIILLTGAYMLVRYREANFKKMALLEQERIVFEYEHLRSQVNPHFLFNSLNTLTTLIEEDPKNAAQYSERLSDLYRNMQIHSSRNLVTLQEELDILDNYIHIQKSRFGDALHVHIDVAEMLKQTRKVIPLALQMLVENAIKHSVVSKAQPLHVYISADGAELTVRNKIQEKHSKDKSSGLGLANISKRYSLATSKSVQYGIENDEFIVRLPLLQY